LDIQIRSVFDEHKQRYGVPRITDELKDRGFHCSENRVSRRMQELGLKGIQAKKFKRTTDSNHDKPVAPDLIEQDFTAAAPNQKWVSDLTYVWTDEGWLYLAVIMDLYSRAIIGWSMDKRMTQQLMSDALTMALFRRGFPKGVIIHSDRGSQYCSKAYQGLIKVMGLRCSMGRRATCYDNAAMESFFHSLKVEMIHRERYATRHVAKGAIFEYIEVYYNRKRKHSAIGHQIPMLFEQKSA
jgi:transposase InsO family protein